MATFGKNPTRWEMLLQHLIVFLICVVFPGLTTLFAPATWLTFTRSGEVAQCRAQTCVFFVVPFRIQEVEQVTGISKRERAGKTERQRKQGRTTGKTVYVDGEGFLQIEGVGENQIEVSVSPASLESVVAKINRFLDSTEQGSRTFFAIANWKFGGLMGGVLTSLTVLYVVGYSLGFLKWIATSLRKALAGGRQ